MYKAVLYNPFRSGWNGRKISYRHANRYESPPRSTSAKISDCSGLFRLFRPVSAGNLVSAGILFGLPLFFFFPLFWVSYSAGPKFIFSSLFWDLSASLFSVLISLFWDLSASLLSVLISPPVCPLFLLPPAASSSSVQSSPAQLQAVASCFCRLQPPLVQPSFKPLPFTHCFCCLHTP